MQIVGPESHWDLQAAPLMEVKHSLTHQIHLSSWCDTESHEICLTASKICVIFRAQSSSERHLRSPRERRGHGLTYARFCHSFNTLLLFPCPWGRSKNSKPPLQGISSFQKMHFRKTQWRFYRLFPKATWRSHRNMTAQTPNPQHPESTHGHPKLLRAVLGLSRSLRSHKCGMAGTVRGLTKTSPKFCTWDNKSQEPSTDWDSCGLAEMDLKDKVLPRERRWVRASAGMWKAETRGVTILLDPVPVRPPLELRVPFWSP